MDDLLATAVLEDELWTWLLARSPCSIDPDFPFPPLDAELPCLLLRSVSCEALVDFVGRVSPREAPEGAAELALETDDR